MIDKMVYECIEKHKGGEKFFDELDARIKDSEEVFDALMDMACRTHPPYHSTIYIVSGKFGVEYGKWLSKKEKFEYIVLEGNLRGNEIDNPLQYKQKIRHRFCVFIDDSYFAGRTYNKVKEMVDSLNGCMMGCVVAYDGSKEYQPHVESLFRYYDCFGEEE